jgi:hypothetical protein
MSERWVDRLFSRLAVRYGAAWLRQWEGLEIEAVKADWMRVLGLIAERNPRAIGHVLDNSLPEFPPTAHGFLRLCQAIPASDGALALPAPREKVAPEVLDRIKALQQRMNVS